MKHLLSALALNLILICGALTGIAAVQPAAAGDKDPLFINLVTDDAHSATMALTFAKEMQERGHPVTVFFNNRGVLLVSTPHSATYPEQQKDVTALGNKGATLIACHHCMDYYGVKESTLLAGIAVGTPELVSKQLFQEGTRTLTW
jgi:sulfur relay (sulfurtransferase) complex TusBCD TusD component (DsrE family)